MPIKDHNSRLEPPEFPCDQSSLFDSFGICKLLDADTRPTFVVQRSLLSTATDRLRPVYSNLALRKDADLVQELFGHPQDGLAYSTFFRWATELSTLSRSTFGYAAIDWHGTVLDDEWLVIGATTALTPSAERIPWKQVSRSSQWELGEDLDWTRSSNSSQFSAWIQYLMDFDWASTALGPMSDWPTELRVMLNIMMRSKSPELLYWGDECISIYNEAFISIAAGKHPLMLGTPAKDAWVELWVDHHRVVFGKIFKTGFAMEESRAFMIERSGFVEEMYFDYSTIPVVDASARVAGILATARETTKSVLAERRLTTLLAVRQQCGSMVAADEFWPRFLQALEPNKEDVPFAVAYMLDMTNELASPKDSSSNQLKSQPKHLRLAGVLGLSSGVLPAAINLEDSADPYTCLFQRGYPANEGVVLQTCDDSLLESIAAAGLSDRGHGAKSKTAVLISLSSTEHDKPYGFLLVGLNARCLYDDDYARFIKLLGTQCVAALSSMIIQQKETRLRQEQSAMEKAVLNAKLAQKTRETRFIEQRFAHVTNNSPSAISISKVDGSMIYVNTAWRQLFGTEEDDTGAMMWMHQIWPEDRGTAAEVWEALSLHKKPVQFEIRITKPWIDETMKEMNLPYTYLMGSAYPELHDDDELFHIVASMTDISHQKWMQGEAQRRMAETMEAKRQQDAFTDMVAHEIRNPLNAIVQCTDIIQTTLRVMKNASEHQAFVNEIIENAATISHCANHQKKIIDDLLVLSKLDSDLLTFVPVTSRPMEIVRNSIKIFQAEADSVGVSLTQQLHSSLATHNVEWMMLDVERVSQVLINLITNAIKFTKDEPRRSVTVSLDIATTSKSFEESHGIQFFPTNRPRTASSLFAGGPLLLFMVSDTGRGIQPSEEARLFQRFSQTSLRTHVKYGGSGLGLWISRELTEMQGGEIGFVANRKEGSAFAFYVQTSHSQPPSDTTASSTASLPLLIPVSSNGRQASTEPSKPVTQTFPTRAASPQPNLKTINVLITEDNLINQTVLKKQLQKIVGKVFVANHGVEALDIVEHSRHWKRSDNPSKTEFNSSNNATSPSASSKEKTAIKPNEPIDVILMDIEMPVMGGVECTKKIRALEAQGVITRRIPIVAVTANARVEQINEYKDAGMDEVLLKPFLVGDLVKLIKRVV